MSVNSAQLVFNGGFIQRKIFGFLKILIDTRVKLIKDDKCEESVYLKKVVVRELNYIRDSVMSMGDYDNKPFYEDNENFLDGIYRAMYNGDKSDIFVEKTYFTQRYYIRHN